MPELFKYSYRVLKFDLTAGLTDFELPIDAQKIVYASPTDGPELLIRLQSKSNDQIPLRPNGEIVAPFQRVYLSATAVARTVFLLIGSPEDLQLTGRDVAISGSIGTRESEEAAVLSASYFLGTVELFSGANLPKAQLFNPAANPKTLLLYEVIVQHWAVASARGAAGASQRIVLATNVNQLTTVWPTPAVNMSSGGAAPSGILRFQQSDLTPEAGIFHDRTWPTAVELRVPLFMLLGPGRGLTVQPMQVGFNMNVQFRWKEF